MPASFQHLSVKDAQKLISSNLNTQIIDIRDPQSFALGHIPKAQHLSNDNVQEFITNTPRTNPVIVCCYHGNSSQSAADFLTQQGFTEVYSLDGGYEEWRQTATSD